MHSNYFPFVQFELFPHYPHYMAERTEKFAFFMRIISFFGHLIGHSFCLVTLKYLIQEKVKLERDTFIGCNFEIYCYDSIMLENIL